VTADDTMAGAAELEAELARLRQRVEELGGQLSWHQEELAETNRGVLALHAELDRRAAALEQAGREQRASLEAERRARAEADGARRRLSVVSEASAAFADTLSHGEVLRRLVEILVPGHADAAAVWRAGETDPAAGAGAPRPPNPPPPPPPRFSLSTYFYLFTFALSVSAPSRSRASCKVPRRGI
jgi:hypothetical protein